jgi:tRNA A37 threonylcarbamoyladenosine dehydratase
MSDKDQMREDRLAAALRENLRKRKAQARDKAPLTPKPPAND